MLTPILIHNPSLYAIASLINLTLGSFFVASHIYQNWLKKINITLLDTNNLVKGIIILLGCTIIHLEKLFYGNFILQPTYFLLGCLVGILYFKFEVWAIKVLPQASAFKFDQIQRKSNNIKNLLNKKTIPIIKRPSESYLSAGIVGLFEEILFRGFIPLICIGLFDFPRALIFIGLSNIIFALSHINLGYQHVLTKFILGSICLIFFLLTGNILISAGIHFVFNILAIKKLESYMHDGFYK